MRRGPLDQTVRPEKEDFAPGFVKHGLIMDDQAVRAALHAKQYEVQFRQPGQGRVPIGADFRLAAQGSRVVEA